MGRKNKIKRTKKKAVVDTPTSIPRYSVVSDRSLSSANKKRFPRKLAGAEACLFAAGCLQYSKEIEKADIYTTEEHPIINWLSPQQRLLLVKEVMIGLLCDDEPLPPETIQHFAAYLGIISSIKIFLEIEVDDISFKAEFIGKDLLPQHVIDEFRRARAPMTPEKFEEKMCSYDVLTRQAEKGKKRFDRQDEASAQNFAAPEEKSISDLRSRFSFMQEALFSGPPLTPQSRQNQRPLAELEESEFYWRKLCDDAFQESDMLRHVHFDWKCWDLKKWCEGLNWLMITEYAPYISDTERALHYGEIGNHEYADKASWPRIREVKRIVQDLRASYDPYWEPVLTAADQRSIFAVCSTELLYSSAHAQWAIHFVTNCLESGVVLTVLGNYQKRLEIYQSMEPAYKEGLSTTYYDGEDGFCCAKTPADFEADDSVFTWCHSDHCFNGEPLKLCGGCRVIGYCSKECQVKDWPSHRKYCDEMRSARKDKAKIADL